MSSFPPPPPRPGGFRRPGPANASPRPPQQPPSRVPPNNSNQQRFAPPPRPAGMRLPAPPGVNPPARQNPPPPALNARSQLPTPPPGRTSGFAPPPPNSHPGQPQPAPSRPGPPPNAARVPFPPAAGQSSPMLNSAPPPPPGPRPYGGTPQGRPAPPPRPGAVPPFTTQQTQNVQHRPPPPSHPYSNVPPPLMANGSYPTAGPPPAYPPNNTNGYAAPPGPTTYNNTPNDSPKPRIDPTQIPKPPLFTRPGLIPAMYYSQQSLGVPPPPADSRFTVVDNGNASPSFIRSTLYTIPTDRGIWRNTGDLPLGVVCTPLASPTVDYTPRLRTSNCGSDLYRDNEAVPLVQGEPQRCRHCFAYANPFWETNGTCFSCGNRVSADTAPPLTRQYGTVEYTVDDGPYCTRSQPVQPMHLVAVDITLLTDRSSVPTLMQILESVFVDLADHWERQRQYQMMMAPETVVPPKMGVCFFSGLGIMVRNRKDDRYFVCADVQDDPFCGIPLENWVFDVSTDREAWLQFIRQGLPTELPHWIRMTAKARVGEGARWEGLEVSCGGAALAFLADALAVSGGRGTMITNRCPMYGAGRFPGRLAEIPLQCQTEFASPAESAAATFYKDLASKCTQARVALSVVMYPGEGGSGTRSLEVSTLSELCRATCGNLVLVPDNADWCETLTEELKREALNFTGWDAVFKVRCSKGLSVKSFVGPMGVAIETLTDRELELSCVSQRTSIAVELEHRVGGLSGPTAFVQTALLYTNLAGKRRLRVSTLGVKTGSALPGIFRSVDFGAQSCFLLRQAVACFQTPDPDTKKKARDLVYYKAILMLANYRQTTNSSPGQLLLPERMQLLPLFCMGLLKSPMLSPNMRGMPNPISPDQRAYYAWMISQAGPAYCMLMTYPNVFEINSDVAATWISPQEEGGTTGCITLPASIVPSMESLQEDRVYLIDDGIRIHLYIGDQVDDHTKAALASPSDSSELRSALGRLIDQLRLFSSTTAEDMRPNSAPLVRVRDKSAIYRLLVADASSTEKDYVDFLCSMHRKIRDHSGKT